MDIEKDIFDDAEDALPDEFQQMTAESIQQRSRLLDNEVRVLKDESQRLTLELSGFKEKIKENTEKIKLNNQLPYLVCGIHASVCACVSQCVCLSETRSQLMSSTP